MEVQGKRRMSRAQDAASIIPTIHIDGLTRNDMTVDSRDGACDILRLRHPVLAASCARDILRPRRQKFPHPKINLSGRPHNPEI